MKIENQYHVIMHAAFHLHNFPEFVAVFGYFGIFLFFITIDQITLIPEEITLLTVGYLSSQQVFNPFIAGFISLAAFIAIDVVYFYLSKKGRRFTAHFHKKLGRNSDILKQKLKQNFPKTLLILCFIPRMRLWAPIVSGTLDIPIKKFMIYDLIGLTLFTAVYIALGVVFHSGLRKLLSEVSVWQHVIFAGFIVVFGVALIFIIKKNPKTSHAS